MSNDHLVSGLAKLAAYQDALLAKANMTGEIDAEAREFLPGVHFCPEWDELAIFKESAEWEACACDIKQSV